MNKLRFQEVRKDLSRIYSQVKELYLHVGLISCELLLASLLVYKILFWQRAGLSGSERKQSGVFMWNIFSSNCSLWSRKPQEESISDGFASRFWKKELERQLEKAVRGSFCCTVSLEINIEAPEAMFWKHPPWGLGDVPYRTEPGSRILQAQVVLSRPTLPSADHPVESASLKSRPAVLSTRCANRPRELEAQEAWHQDLVRKITLWHFVPKGIW